MGCQVFVYDSLLNSLGSGRHSVQIMAINKKGVTVEVQSAATATAGYGAVLASAGEYHVLVREGGNLLSPSNVRGVNGNKPNRVDLVMYPLFGTPKPGGPSTRGTASSVRRHVQSQTQQQIWSPPQGAAVEALFSNTSMLLQLATPDLEVLALISRWTNMLADFGIAIDDD